MKTKTMTISKWSVLALAASVLACELPLYQLEAGDSMDGTDEDTGMDSSGDGDGDGEASLECVVQGTNIAGGDEPVDFPLPECEVVCATGWGHGAAPLANEWTIEVEPMGDSTGYTFLEATPAGDLVVVIGRHGAAARLVWVSPEGELLDELTQPAIDNDVWSVAITDEGNIVVLWRQADKQVVTALSSSGEHLWTVELGSYEGQFSVLAAFGSGVVVALNSALVFEDGDLLYVDSNGGVMGLGSIPPTQRITVSPSGNTVVVANPTTISWTNFELFPTETSMQGVADVGYVASLIALDDERVVIAGSAENWDEGGMYHAFVEQIGPMGLEWEGRYDRALDWCGGPEDPTPMEEHNWDVERLADGSLLVVGNESAVDNLQSDLGYFQPRVAHVSAQGEVLATDRGFWSGMAAAVASTQDAAYVLLFVFEGSQQHIHLRKYLP